MDDVEQKPECSQNEKEKPDSVTTENYHLKYGVDDNTPIHICILYGFQLLLANVGGPVLAIYIIFHLICTERGKDDLLFAELISTSIFVAGISTFVQVTFGIRLPVIQGSAFSFIAPIASMMATGKHRCPPRCDTNVTVNADLGITSIPCEDEPWKARLLEINGSLILASLVHIAVGATGIIGFLQKYIGPITLCPAFSLVGLTLYPTMTEHAQDHWGLACFTGGLYLVFVLFAAKINVPLPTWTKQSGFGVGYFPIFKLLPEMLAVGGGWLLAFILTETGQLTDDENNLQYSARTDSTKYVLEQSKWFFWPRPGYWGTPTFGVGLLVGFIAVVLSSIMESLGDYYAMGAICGLPTPPKHAVNRGIFVEGICSVVSGLLGACHATTSYSGVVGTVLVTGVASRITFQVAAIMFIIFGVVGKIGAALSTIPDPVLSGLGMAMFGVIIAIGLSFLRHCDLTSTRNLVILGVSFIAGLLLPSYVEDNPGSIDTGYSDLDEALITLMSTGMLIGAVVGFVLDNLTPGTREERGLVKYQADLAPSADEEKSVVDRKAYDLPYVSDWMRRQPLLTYVPFLPSYKDRDCPCCCRSCWKRGKNSYDIEA